MGFLNRLRGRTVPPWARDFMDAGQYEAFDGAIHDDLRARGWTYRQEDDGIFIDAAPGDPPIVLGLTNIAQRCASIERSQWPAAIHAHFDGMQASRDAATEPPAWETVRPLLKLRVFPAEQAGSMSMVTYPLTPGLVAALVADYPTTIQLLTPTSIAGWPPVDELYTVALENLRAEPVPEARRVGEGRAAFDALLDDSFFTAARVLLLPDGVDLAGAVDAIVSMPNRHALLVHPIRDAGVLDAAGAMIGLTTRLFEEGPGSIARDLFWWHGGALTTLPVHVDGRSTSFHPPDAFLERIKTLEEPRTGGSRRRRGRRIPSRAGYPRSDARPARLPDHRRARRARLEREELRWCCGRRRARPPVPRHGAHLSGDDR